MKPRKILICGLPGAGKTTLAYALSQNLNAIVYDGDRVRELCLNFNFDNDSRLSQAKVMCEMCDNALLEGHTALASFVCPTSETRAAFWGDTPRDDQFTVFVDRIAESAYPDTNAIFMPPAFPNYTVKFGSTVEESVADIMEMLADPLDWTAPTAVFIGRYQPFHQGHRALIEHGIRKYGQAWIGVREMVRGPSNPYSYAAVEKAIHKALSPNHAGKFMVSPIPNVASVMYGRDVGYKVEEVRLSPTVEAISATKIRAGEQK
jgi:adenylylsulfate kinase